MKLVNEPSPRVGRGSRRRRRGTGRRSSRAEGGACRIRSCLLGLWGRVLLHPRHRHLPARLRPRSLRVQRRLGPSVLAVADRLPVDRPHQPRRPHADRLRHLRAFVRYEIARRTGHFHSGTAIRQGNAEPAIGVDFFGQAQHQIVLDKAFIQFAGVTAGRATSFFDFYANDLGWFGIGGGSDRASTNLLAYTASFGSGWSATLSLEDPVERRYPVVTNLGGATLVAGGTLFSAAAAPIQIFNPITGLPINSAFVGQQQRNAMPDIVAAVRVDQPWGSAQLSGIIHQISTIGATIPAGNIFAGATFTGFRPDTEYGYGIQAGVKLNLPMIAPGDLLYLQAVYARGCIDCVVGGAWVLGGGTAGQGGFPGTNGRFAYNTADGILNPLTNEVTLSKEWGAVAAFLHYWTPQLRSGFQLAY